MFKSLSALAIFLALGAAVIALPGFAPEVAAGEGTVLSKGDRLELRAIDPECARQVWPNFVAPCLRDHGSREKISEARLVTAQR